MKKQGKNYIFPSEKTASIRIYPATQSFYDFGRAIGGDSVKLWSHVRGCDSWTALKEIRLTFGLSAPNRACSRDLIRKQEEARRQRIDAEKEAKREWVQEVDQLKAECELYQAILDSGHFEPLSWAWCLCKNWLLANGKLDLLCEIY